MTSKWTEVACAESLLRRCHKHPRSWWEKGSGSHEHHSFLRTPGWIHLLLVMSASKLCVYTRLTSDICTDYCTAPCSRISVHIIDDGKSMHRLTHSIVWACCKHFVPRLELKYNSGQAWIGRCTCTRQRIPKSFDIARTRLSIAPETHDWSNLVDIKASTRFDWKNCMILLITHVGHCTLCLYNEKHPWCELLWNARGIRGNPADESGRLPEKENRKND